MVGWNNFHIYHAIPSSTGWFRRNRPGEVPAISHGDPYGKIDPPVGNLGVGGPNTTEMAEDSEEVEGFFFSGRRKAAAKKCFFLRKRKKKPLPSGQIICDLTRVFGAPP